MSLIEDGKCMGCQNEPAKKHEEPRAFE
jgi:hypothetical protein